MTYSVNSFDTSIAFIGGYVSLVWMVFGVLIGSYQDFRYNSGLINKLFTEEKKARPAHHIEEKDTDEVIATVINRQPLKYRYREWRFN